ncbi:SMC-Scp complex subunit ScpB [Selenomonas dianae]|uniref:SMC-Scp complex subunit ScpB n=1 Tax=Selenomonas dianae TaxID=135079 RepID=A0ABN0SZ00_9FIRM|nr:SMC-Scp complex subunit ScpB [Selenomonas dianae]WLD83398.1 SMC-Scp complex subunit ScpB [Selenomonas dianae]
MQPLSRAGILEAVLFAAGTPLSVPKISEIIEIPEWEVQETLTQLEQILSKRESGIFLRRSAGGYQLVTHPNAFPWVKKLSETVQPTLSSSAMETLSIIAYKQPITKQEVEHIRGVRAERSIGRLLELELICEMGRKQVVGRPILYGTTDLFLRAFGLEQLSDLPALPNLDDVKDTLDDDQLRLFEEMHAATDTIDHNEAHNDVEV